MEPTERWTPQLASDLYDVASWGKGYFSVGDNGHVRVHPEKDPARAIDLKQLVDTLVLRGISLPILIRFADILKHRLGEIHNAFQTAIAEHRYQGGYCCVYPIKVNQQRQVVEEVLEFGKPFKFGLEAGSKPELMAVMALADNQTPIICNGFKDDEYIEMAMLAQKAGRMIIPVVEKYTELHLILKYSARVGVRPSIGLRVKLASRGSGRWPMIVVSVSLPSAQLRSTVAAPRMRSPRTRPFGQDGGSAGRSRSIERWLCTSISAIPAVYPRLPSIWKIRGGCNPSRFGAM